MCHFKPCTSLLFQTLGNYETLETIENFVWHNNESMGFKMAHLKVWGLICHKDKNIDCFFFGGLSPIRIY